MKKTIKAFFKIAGSASTRWWGKDPFMQSAVIAYYAIFIRSDFICWFFAANLAYNHYYHCSHGRLGDESLAKH
jgi:hypothetical protein